MLRPSLVVEIDFENRNSSFTCESIHVNIDGTVTVFSSGKPLTVPAESVKAVTYHGQGAGFCPWCDQSIEHFSKA